MTNYREALRAVREQRLAKERGRIPVEFNMSVKDREKLGALFRVWCDCVGTGHPDTVFGMVYHIDTVGGVFRTHYDPWSGAIFGRFERPEKKFRSLESIPTPHSGKWNIHTVRGDDPQDIFGAWRRAVEKVTVSKLVFVEEDGMWSAHDPKVPGAYGLGPTREAAEADLREALAVLAEHDAQQAEDAEDVRLADKALDEIHAGGTTFTHDEMLKRCGLATVKIGIVSDIHGDIVALDAALARLREMKCEPIICAGDLIDLEPFGEEVVQRVKADGIVCIRGNHERWALERRRRKPDLRKSGPSIVEAADLFSGGTELSREALAYLSTLPSHWAAELAGARVAMWHARPGSDMEGIRADATSPALRRRLLDQSAVDVLIVGHTHDAFSLVAGKGRIVNPGACCSKTLAYKQSGALAVPDGYRPATFGVLELPSKRFSVFCAVDGERVGPSDA